MKNIIEDIVAAHVVIWSVATIIYLGVCFIDWTILPVIWEVLRMVEFIAVLGSILFMAMFDGKEYC